jgi:hypothetical protein
MNTSSTSDSSINYFKTYQVYEKPFKDVVKEKKKIEKKSDPLFFDPKELDIDVDN